MTLATIVGARPQFIKAAVVARAFQSTPAIDEVLIHTGQHYDENLSEQFFVELDLARPAYHLDVGSGTHGQQSGRMIERIEQVLFEVAPDVVLVYGDTNSTLAGALAAAKIPLPVAHVEAGLRSFNQQMPEEVNRVLTDHAAAVLLAPTQAAVHNLRREGLPDARIHQVGDVMYDAALHFGRRAEAESRILEQLSLQPGRYVLATVHRAANTDHPERLAALLEGLMQASDDQPVVLPLHPRTRQAAERQGLLDAARRRLHLIEPVGYLDMLRLEQAARLIVTDSGGVQKEAFFHRVPCVTLRAETEWTELVELGWNRLVPPESPTAVRQALLRDGSAQRGEEAQPYGQGDSAFKIRDVLLTNNEELSVS